MLYCLLEEDAEQYRGSACGFLLVLCLRRPLFPLAVSVVAPRGGWEVRFEEGAARVGVLLAVKVVVREAGAGCASVQ